MIVSVQIASEAGIGEILLDLPSYTYAHPLLNTTLAQFNSKLCFRLGP